MFDPRDSRYRIHRPALESATRKQRNIFFVLRLYSAVAVLAFAEVSVFALFSAFPFVNDSTATSHSGKCKRCQTRI
jgi:hypothetical protein